jgi:hypothetical protein
MLRAQSYLITLSALASTFGGTLVILDFGFSILDWRIIGLLDLLLPKHWTEWSIRSAWPFLD